VWAPEEEQGKNEGFGVASQVNYVVQGGLLKLGRTDQDNTEVSLGSASVVSRYLRNTWLWDEVRVKGGAYGGFCSFDGVSNVFAYGSYRDPNLEATLNVYKQVRWVMLEEVGGRLEGGWREVDCLGSMGCALGRVLLLSLWGVLGRNSID
jgi:Zn-dependent M16 (insulinase) family peptidase